MGDNDKKVVVKTTGEKKTVVTTNKDNVDVSKSLEEHMRHNREGAGYKKGINGTDVAVAVLLIVTLGAAALFVYYLLDNHTTVLKEVTTTTTVSSIRTQSTVTTAKIEYQGTTTAKTAATHQVYDPNNRLPVGTTTTIRKNPLSTTRPKTTTKKTTTKATTTTSTSTTTSETTSTTSTSTTTNVLNSDN